VFEISAGDERSAFRLRTQIETGLDRLIAPALDAAFDSLADGAEAVVLDRLEVDLGEIPAAGLDGARLRRAVADALARRLGRTGGPREGETPPRRLATPLALAAALARFLATGHLHWRTPAASVDELLAAVQASAPLLPAGMVPALRSVLGREAALERLVYQVEPEFAAALLTAVGLPRDAEPADGWAAAIRAARGTPPGVRALARRIAILLSGGRPADDVAEPGRSSVPEDAAARRRRPDPAQGRGAETDLPGSDPAPEVGFEEPDVDAGSPLYAVNAGLVLLHPFLSQFFRTCELLDPADGFRSSDAQAMAVHLLHYAATGATGPAEPDTLLPKLLCGVAVEEPMPRHLELDPAHLAEADAMLRAVIGNWRRLGSTSPAGLREAFLAREGRLDDGPLGWRLTIERRGADILLDSLPWALSAIRLPWMARTLFVSWA
jgi:hypothetical protein